MLRAATSVVGIGCGSIAFFGVLAGGLGEAFLIGLIGPVERITSGWGGKLVFVRLSQKRLPQPGNRAHEHRLLYLSTFYRCALG